MIGRRFTELFAAALLVLVGGVAFRNVVVVEAGIAGIAAAFGFAAIWQRWCVPHRCYVVGAMLWGLKRAAVGALLLGIGLVSVPTGLLAIGLFICAGLCTAYLRQHRCFLPKLSTPLAALPMW